MSSLTEEQIRERFALSSRQLDVPNDIAIGRSIFYTETCESTNDIITMFGDAGIDEGVVVFAKQQTVGRGRQKSKWFSHPGSLECSFLIRPSKNLSHVPFVNVLVSYAILKTIYELTRLPAMLKWPNDIIVSNKKLCGVLSEMRSAGENSVYVSVGLGLNLDVPASDFPTEVRSLATSLYNEEVKPVREEKFLEIFLPEMNALYTTYCKRQAATE